MALPVHPSGLWGHIHMTQSGSIWNCKTTLLPPPTKILPRCLAISHMRELSPDTRVTGELLTSQDRIYLLPPNPSPHCNNHQGPQAEARAPEESHSNEVGQRAKGVDRPPAPSPGSGNSGPLRAPDIRTSHPQHLSNPAMALLTRPSSLHCIFNNSATKLKDSQVQNPQQSPDLTYRGTNY